MLSTHSQYARGAEQRPHIRALARLKVADDKSRADPDLNDEILQAELDKQYSPVLAALVRVGVVKQGSEKVSEGLFSIPRAETYSITGVNDFGRKLLLAERRELALFDEQGVVAFEDLSENSVAEHDRAVPMPVTSEYVHRAVGVEAGTPCARRAARQRTFAVASLTANFSLSP